MLPTVTPFRTCTLCSPSGLNYRDLPPVIGFIQHESIRHLHKITTNNNLRKSMLMARWVKIWRISPLDSMKCVFYLLSMSSNSSTWIQLKSEVNKLNNLISLASSFHLWTSSRNDIGEQSILNNEACQVSRTGHWSLILNRKLITEVFLVKERVTQLNFGWPLLTFWKPIMFCQSSLALCSIYEPC